MSLLEIPVPLGRPDDAALKVIRRVMETEKDPLVLRALVRALGQAWSDVETDRALRALVSDSRSLELQVLAISCLKHHAEAETRQALRQWLADQSKPVAVRIESAFAISADEDDSSLDALQIELVRTADTELATGILSAVSEGRSARRNAILLGTLSSAVVDEVKAQAVSFLVKGDDDTGFEMGLSTSRISPSSTIRAALARSLGENLVTGKHAGRGRQVLLDLLLSDPESIVRQASAEALAGEGDPEVLDALRQASRHDPDPVVRAVAERYAADIRKK